jgi:hypothetical protein
MGDDDEEVGEEEAPIVCVIAKPLADSKLTKKILKVVKKGARACTSSRTVTISRGLLIRDSQTLTLCVCSREGQAG